MTCPPSMDRQVPLAREETTDDEVSTSSHRSRSSFINPCSAEFILGEEYLHFLLFLKCSDGAGNQYHGCWWPGDTRSQGINNHCIDTACPKYSGIQHPKWLTLNVRGPSYLGLTRSISWLLMPWLLPSPGHQKPWYWLCRIGGFLSYLRKDFKYLRRINVEKWHKM